MGKLKPTGRNVAYLLLGLINQGFAIKVAANGDIARTIVYCFATYICLQLMEREG